MKHAYLIMAHGNRKLLEILLELLDEKDNDIYIHFDAKSDIDPEAFSGCVQRASLRCYKKIRVFWGDLSLTRCQFYLLKEAVKQHHDYYHLISGSDLPLKTCREIEELFLRYKGRQFISFDSKGPSESVNCKYLHPLRPLITRCKNRQSSLARGLHKMDEYFVDLQKKRGKATGLSRGSNWYDITHELAVDFVSHEKELLKAVRWAFPPDESVLQTYFRKYGGRFVLYGTEPDYERSILRKIDWQRGNGFSPYTWRSEDYEELMDSDMLFARKFDWDVDRNIILRIRETLLQRRNEEKAAIGEARL